MGITNYPAVHDVSKSADVQFTLALNITYYIVCASSYLLNFTFTIVYSTSPPREESKTKNDELSLRLKLEV